MGARGCTATWEMRDGTEADTAADRSLFAKKSDCENELQLVLLVAIRATLLLLELVDFALVTEAVTGTATAAMLQVAIAPTQLKNLELEQRTKPTTQILRLAVKLNSESLQWTKTALKFTTLHFTSMDLTVFQRGTQLSQ
jgi:hypothetical protein